jgi:endonuclease/exonuclease/phosphatase (EEP) superfamily protein YafD
MKVADRARRSLHGSPRRNEHLPPGDAGGPGSRSRPRATRLALLYLLGAGLLWLLSRSFAERTWWNTLLLYTPQGIYLVPALLTVPAALFARDRRALALNALALVAVAGPVMGFNVPASRAPAGGPRVRVLEYNIRAAEVGLPALMREVERCRPDLVLFCEARRRPGEPALPPELKAAFTGWHAATADEVFMASRWPLARRETMVLPGAPYREALRARVEAPFGPFTLAVAHLSEAFRPGTIREEGLRLPEHLERLNAARREQVQGLLSWLGEGEEPLILAGDFNTPPQGDLYGSLAAQFGDSFREAGWGWGYTYPARPSLVRIDYVFHSRHWQPLRCRVGEGAASDHRPLIADLAFAR